VSARPPLLALAALHDLPASAAFADCWLPRFSDSERQRLERLSRPLRRQQFIAAHALLRLAAASLDVPADSLRCEVDGDGRPRIEAPAGWQASLSHSGAYVAVLLDRGTRPVGVDIEQMRAERDIVAIVRAACGVDAGSRDQAYQVWAAHEARLKTAADGVPAAGDMSAWHASFDGHALAVAGTRQPPDGLELFDWKAEIAAERSTRRVQWIQSV
jgi:phosphopantetheinyl transferase